MQQVKLLGIFVSFYIVQIVKPWLSLFSPQIPLAIERKYFCLLCIIITGKNIQGVFLEAQLKLTKTLIILSSL